MFPGREPPSFTPAARPPTGSQQYRPAISTMASEMPCFLTGKEVAGLLGTRRGTAMPFRSFTVVMCKGRLAGPKGGRRQGRRCSPEGGGGPARRPVRYWATTARRAARRRACAAFEPREAIFEVHRSMSHAAGFERRAVFRQAQRFPVKQAQSRNRQAPQPPLHFQRRPRRA